MTHGEMVMHLESTMYVLIYICKHKHLISKFKAIDSDPITKTHGTTYASIYIYIYIYVYIYTCTSLLGSPPGAITHMHMGKPV